MEDRLFDPTPTLTVSDVLSRARVVVERAFRDEVWVEGEIHGLSRRREHVYFDLVEADASGRPAARLPIVLFETYRRGVNVLLKRAGIARMEDGLHIRIRGEVSVYGRTGQIQLKMLAIDPHHTIGLLAAERDRVLAALQAEGLLRAQAGLAVVAVPLRVALVTARGSAAAEDFLDELRASGLAFSVRLHDVRVQGREAEASVVAALSAVGASGGSPEVDVVALVRGGGSRTDLAAFDGEGIARAIAACGVPVLAGLGHEIDRAVADDVAHASLKTPTACAAWLVERVRAWWGAVDACWAGIDACARRRLAGADAEHAHHRRLVAMTGRGRVAAAEADLAHHRRRVAVAGRGRLADAEAELVRRRQRVAAAGRATVIRADQRRLDVARTIRARVRPAADRADRNLDRLAGVVAAYDPARTLARGWSITRTGAGDLVRSPDDAPPGTPLVTTVAAGTVHSRAEPPHEEEEP